ncbi:MAG: sialidase family protein [Armatimonadota bacterium]
MPIETVQIARNDEVYECFPDCVKTTSGKIIVIYRESEAHACREFSDLVMRHSTDEGLTWSDRQVLIQSAKDDKALFKWNCPRVSQLSDGRLVALCDGYRIPPGEISTRDSRTFLWFSDDDGETWEGPEETPITGIVPDKIYETKAGTWLVAAHVGRKGQRGLWQRVFRSTDSGESWEGPIDVAKRDGLNLCEASVIQLPDERLVAYMRENSGKGWSAYKAISEDDGKSWHGPYETHIPACHRPVSGYLPSGRIMVTFAYMMPGTERNRANFMAYTETPESAGSTSLQDQGGQLLCLDHDRSDHPDQGYCGWCVLDDDSLFVVNYINDDAPMAQIRGYFFTEDEF